MKRRRETVTRAVPVRESKRGSSGRLWVTRPWIFALRSIFASRGLQYVRLPLMRAVGSTSISWATSSTSPCIAPATTITPSPPAPPPPPRRQDACPRRVQPLRDRPGHPHLAADQPRAPVYDGPGSDDHRAAARVQVAPDAPADRDSAAAGAHVAEHVAPGDDGAGGDDEVALHAPGGDDAASGRDQVALDVGPDVHPAAEGVQVAGHGGTALDDGLADLWIGGARAGRGREERQ